MKVVVIGANGQLGTDVVREFRRASEEVVELTHSDVELASLESTRSVLDGIRPALVVNTAAMHHVENCEKEPARAYEINALGVRNLAISARELSAKLVHVSTDYVFDGRKNCPYVETDTAAPLNVYGNTKLAGEAFLQGLGEKCFILRTSALYGKSPCRAKGGRNFVDLMLKAAAERKELRVVNDEWISPTSTTELARQIAILSQTTEYGLYHATAESCCSWYEFAQAIFETTNTKVSLEVARPNEFPAKVPRPKYSVLDNAALKKRGLNAFNDWREGLLSYLSSDALRACEAVNS
jgi:dTDP-4-dehydrorhamnose reductase